MKLILNADDLGFSLGIINYAVLKSFSEGALTHSSLVSNSKYFEHAVIQILPLCQGLKVGVHLNLTSGKPLSLHKKSELTDSEGFFKLSFIDLLFLKKTFTVRKIIYKEFDMQFNRLRMNNIDISQFNNNSGKVRFYSILRTCIIKPETLLTYLQNQKRENCVIEIMLHPSLKEYDSSECFNNARTRKSLISEYRLYELNVCLNDDIKKYVRKND